MITKKRFAYLFLFVLVVQSYAQQSPLPVPPGLTVQPKPKAESLESQCANYTDREWFVSLENRRLKWRLVSEKENRKAPLPFEIALETDDEDGLGGRRIAYSIKDGWLVGFNAGEFGGSLWWFSTDGKQNKKITNGNIKYITNLSDEIIVLEGLAHLTSAAGSVLRISKSENGTYQEKVLARLDGEPYAFVSESIDSLLVLTTSGLRRMKISGAIEKLIETDYGMYYPTSMVRLEDGSVYVGMRRYITRLIPGENGYKEEWFVSSDCVRYAIRELSCQCVSKKTIRKK
jgi:hypothetical protein